VGVHGTIPPNSYGGAAPGPKVDWWNERLANKVIEGAKKEAHSLCKYENGIKSKRDFV